MKKDGKAKFIITISLWVILTDQLTKYIIAKSLAVNQSIAVAPFLKISHIHNIGAAFGLFRGLQLLFVAFALLVIIATIYYFDKIPEKDKFLQGAIALILGGAIGNLIDRILWGYVIDFIDFIFWPAFNVADSAITVGAIIFALYLFRSQKK